MDKLQELNHFIVQYGYLAIFLLVFLQEIGIPNPITNELVLMFSGYLAYRGVLSISKILLVAIAADFIGTSILYFIFYALRKYSILKHSSSRIQKLIAKVEILKQRIHNGNQWTIFLGRLTPFLRGYISVAAGILLIKPQAFLKTVLLSAVTWSGGLVLAGRIIGPYWNELVQKIGAIRFVMLLIILIVALTFAGKCIMRKELGKD